MTPPKDQAEQRERPVAYDVKGFPIERGDLLRTFHFKDGRRNTWLYHVACLRPDGYLEAVPARYLDHDDKGGGRYNLIQCVVDSVKCEIVQGLHDNVQFYERPRRRIVPDLTANE